MQSSVDQNQVDEDIKQYLPRVRHGNILPTHRYVKVGPGYLLYQVAPTDVMSITATLGMTDYSAGAVDAAILNVWNCVDALVREQADPILLEGVPVCARLGRDRTRKIVAEMERRSGVPCYSTLESVIASLGRLGATRLAIGSRFAPDLNEAVVRYFEDGGVHVSAITERGQDRAEAHAMTLEQGMAEALHVAREAAALDPEADAVYVPGGAALSLHVIPLVEGETGKAVVTSQSAELWYGLVRPGLIPPLDRWGRLLGLDAVEEARQ